MVTNKMTTPTDTPRTDACPHCGDKYDSEKFFRYECGTLQQFPSGTIRTELCHQTEVSNIWQKRAKKAEAEVERLRDELAKGEKVLSTIVSALEDAVPWIRETLNRD